MEKFLENSKILKISESRNALLKSLGALVTAFLEKHAQKNLTTLTERLLESYLCLIQGEVEHGVSKEIQQSRRYF